jgi:hypothetical protein
MSADSIKLFGLNLLTPFCKLDHLREQEIFVYTNETVKLKKEYAEPTMGKKYKMRF